MIVGYARVSTGEQNLELQIDALTSAGCERIYEDKISGKTRERPGLEKALAAAKTGDTLVVWRLDRLGRSLSHLVELVSGLKIAGVGFRSVCDGAIDTTSASGELVFHIFASLAQFERRLIQERTKAGLVAARARGRCGGRKPIARDDPKVISAQRLMSDPRARPADVARVLGVSRSTLYRYLALKS